jgi:phage-related protein
MKTTRKTELSCPSNVCKIKKNIYDIQITTTVYMSNSQVFHFLYHKTILSAYSNMMSFIGNINCDVIEFQIYLTLHMRIAR